RRLRKRGKVEGQTLRRVTRRPVENGDRNAGQSPQQDHRPAAVPDGLEPRDARDRVQLQIRPERSVASRRDTRTQRTNTRRGEHTGVAEAATIGERAADATVTR